jgi:hypothetical protein
MTLSTADMTDLTFYLAFQVAILASLPCYMTVYHDYMGGEGIWYVPFISLASNLSE